VGCSLGHELFLRLTELQGAGVSTTLEFGYACIANKAPVDLFDDLDIV